MIEVLWADNYKNGKITEKLFNAAVDEINKINSVSEYSKREFSNLQNPAVQEYIKGLADVADIVGDGLVGIELAESMVRKNIREAFTK